MARRKSYEPYTWAWYKEGVEELLQDLKKQGYINYTISRPGRNTIIRIWAQSGKKGERFVRAANKAGVPAYLTLRVKTWKDAHIFLTRKWWFEIRDHL